jgi:hypothetical protein
MFNNHIAYSLLAGMAIRLFGTAEWALRTPSLILAVLALLVVWRLGSLLDGRATAWGSLLCLATMPFFAPWSHMARGYAGLTAMTLVSMYGFLLLLRHASRGAGWFHAVASALAVYFNLYGIWLIAAEYLVFGWLVLWPSGNPGSGTDVDAHGLQILSKSFWAIAAAVVLLYLPVAGDLLQVAIATGRTPLRTTFPQDLYHEFAGTTSLMLGVALGVVSMIGLARQRATDAALVILSIALPLLIMWAVVRPAALFTRFFVFWAPMFAYLVASGSVGLAAWSWRNRTRHAGQLSMAVAGLACVVIALVGGQWVRADRAPWDDGYAFLRPLAGDEHRRSFAVGGNSEMFAYYMAGPFAVLRSPRDLNVALREYPSLRVAYHNMDWNSADDRTLLESLKTWCRPDDHGVVTVFRCGP